MPNSNPKLLIEVSSSRELDVRIRGTPDSLRRLATTLLSAIEGLPSPLQSQQTIYPKDFGFGEANGSKRETYLGFQVSPTLDISPAKRIRRRLWDWMVVVFAVAFLLFAVIGFMAAMKWIADHVA
jgi:hypothetical protein